MIICSFYAAAVMNPAALLQTRLLSSPLYMCLDAAHVTCFSKGEGNGPWRRTSSQLPVGSSLSVGTPWAKEKIKTNRTLISGLRSLCSAADRRSPLQEGCLKSKLPARHLLLRRSVSQKQNQQKQLFIPFDVGFEVTPPLPLCPPFLVPPLPHPAPPAFFILLPRKQGHANFFLRKASLKEQQLLFLILHQANVTGIQ